MNEFIEKDSLKYKVIIVNNILPFMGSGYSKWPDIIYDKLEVGGIFVGVFFGENHPWNDGRSLKFHLRSEALSELSKYEILNFQETDSKLGMLNGWVKSGTCLN